MMIPFSFFYCSCLFVFFLFKYIDVAVFAGSDRHCNLNNQLKFQKNIKKIVNKVHTIDHLVKVRVQHYGGKERQRKSTK
jgi:hypothetical protein